MNKILDFSLNILLCAMGLVIILLVGILITFTFQFIFGVKPTDEQFRAQLEKTCENQTTKDPEPRHSDQCVAYWLRKIAEKK